jgi:DNA-binding MarR family transcriptional regulator
MGQNVFDDPMSDRIENSRAVTLSGRDLRDATRLLRTLLENTDETLPSSSAYARHLLVESARQAVAKRQTRRGHFPAEMFGEPGWDILLILYTEEQNTRLPVSRLVTASGCPATTGLRWLEYLESQDLVCRRPHPTDRRVELVELTKKGRDALDSYFSETLTKG